MMIWKEKCLKDYQESYFAIIQMPYRTITHIIRMKYEVWIYDVWYAKIKVIM